MAGGVMLGGVLQLAVQLPVLYRWAAAAHWRELGRRARGLGRARRAPHAHADGSGILLGVGVAQISLMINTQIASYLAPGSVTWLFYADRLMEFPTALLGVALGVVLTPQLARRQGRG
jgi:putative peptidoglycan lipid II flippase